LRGRRDCHLVGSAQGIFTVGSGEEAGQQMLAKGRADLPDAVVCANDQMAIGMVQALSAAGVRVPCDIAVVGFDDIFPGSLCDPPLTTVHQPMRLLGERACTRLLDRIARPGLRQKVETLPTELVLRSSCGCPPGTMIREPVPRLRASRPVAAATDALAPLARRDLTAASS
ncbi:MAG: substrate-binding domain-containing protein, partial [Nocardiopsaceae bacterium]|jgi:LacI family transcriptional regulator|nr:substrate-binding domain-containing protein [Nocardiopsaceae bacterium]